MVLHLAKFSNQTYTMRPYKASTSKNPVVTIDFNNNGEKIPVSFQLADKGSQWKIRKHQCFRDRPLAYNSVTSSLRL